jgi:ADP-ribose pyrophosphatase
MSTHPNSTDADRAPRITGRRTLHKGRKFDFELLTVLQGGKETFREVVRHPGAVVVVPILEDGRVVLIRNHRVALGEGERLWECCAGTIEPPEEPILCAGRELIEETGYRAATLASLGWFYTTPGLTDERMHGFVATGLTHIGQDLEDDESIAVDAVPAQRVLEMISTGELRDAKSMLAILLAQRANYLPQ